MYLAHLKNHCDHEQNCLLPTAYLVVLWDTCGDSRLSLSKCEASTTFPICPADRFVTDSHTYSEYQHGSTRTTIDSTPTLNLGFRARGSANVQSGSGSATSGLNLNRTWRSGSGQNSEPGPGLGSGPVQVRTMFA